MTSISSIARRLNRAEKMAPTPRPVRIIHPSEIAFQHIWEALAIAGLGQPRPDEPLRDAWARVVEIVEGGGMPRSCISALGVDRAYFSGDSKIDLAKVHEVADSIPPWLFAFASLNFAYKILEWPLRDVEAEAESMTPAATLDLIESWPCMPSGAYFGDFSNNDARARWNAIFNSARQTGFAVCNGFALYSPSASQKLTDCNLICLGTFYPEASGGSDDGGVSMSNPTSSDRRSAFAKAVDSCSDRSEPGIDLDRSG